MVPRNGSHWCKSGLESPFSSFPLSIWTYLQTHSGIPPGCWDGGSCRWHFMLYATTCSPLPVTTSNWARTGRTCSLLDGADLRKRPTPLRKRNQEIQKGWRMVGKMSVSKSKLEQSLDLCSILCFQDGCWWGPPTIFLLVWCCKLHLQEKQHHFGREVVLLKLSGLSDVLLCKGLFVLHAHPPGFI